MKNKSITPTQIYVHKDTANLNIKGRYISFFIVGTWKVRIDNLYFLPGDTFSRDIYIGTDEVFDITPRIEFIEDLAADATVSSNKRLETGKKILIEYVKIKECLH